MPIATAFFVLGRYEEGRSLAMKSIQFMKDAHSLGAYIMNSVSAGRPVEASEAVAQLLKLQPDFRASHAQEAFPICLSEARDRMAAALRDAGVPE